MAAEVADGCPFVARGPSEGKLGALAMAISCRKLELL